MSQKETGATEDMARNLHAWYLEATAKLSPESYNPNAQKHYDDLTDEQQFIDRYIAQKIMIKCNYFFREGVNRGYEESKQPYKIKS